MRVIHNARNLDFVLYRWRKVFYLFIGTHSGFLLDNIEQITQIWKLTSVLTTIFDLKPNRPRRGQTRWNMLVVCIHTVDSRLRRCAAWWPGLSCPAQSSPRLTSPRWSPGVGWTLTTKVLACPLRGQHPDDDLFFYFLSGVRSYIYSKIGSGLNLFPFYTSIGSDQNSVFSCLSKSRLYQTTVHAMIHFKRSSFLVKLDSIWENSWHKSWPYNTIGKKKCNQSIDKAFTSHTTLLPWRDTMQDWTPLLPWQTNFTSACNTAQNTHTTLNTFWLPYAVTNILVGNLLYIPALTLAVH